MISYVCMYVISYVDGFTDMQYLTTLSIYHPILPRLFDQVFIVIGMVNFNWNSLNQEDKRTQIIADSVILAWYLIVIYSLGTFTSEVSRGIMSPANHPREKYSCCCNV